MCGCLCFAKKIQDFNFANALFLFPLQDKRGLRNNAAGLLFAASGQSGQGLGESRTGRGSFHDSLTVENTAVAWRAVSTSD